MAIQSIPSVRIPQARVLYALLPSNAEYPIEEWPLMTRKLLNVAVGYSPISTGITRPMYGIKEGSSSGKPYPGLLALGLVEEIKVNVDGVIEETYRITRLGILALTQFIVEGGVLPEMDDKARYTNKRYQSDELPR